MGKYDLKGDLSTPYILTVDTTMVYPLPEVGGSSQFSLTVQEHTSSFWEAGRRGGESTHTSDESDLKEVEH